MCHIQGHRHASTRLCDVTCSYVWHDSFICTTWRDSCMCVTRTACSYVWHDSFICVTWLTHMCDMIHSYVWHDSFICVTWLIHMCDVTHSYLWHDSLICVTWLIHMCESLNHMCDMTHSYAHVTRSCEGRDSFCIRDMNHSFVWHDSFMCVTWLVRMRNMTRTWTSRYDVTHFMCVTRWYGVATISRLLKFVRLFCKRAQEKRLYSAKKTYDLKEPTNRSHLTHSGYDVNHFIVGLMRFISHTFIGRTWLMSHVSHYDTWWVWRVSFHMGWLRLVGSLKLYVSLAEYSLFYRALLQKRSIILRSVLIVATP